jgi:hypothetical protein
MTLREYFHGHPNLHLDGSFQVIAGSKDFVRYCGVPVNRDLWDMLKADQLDTPLSEELLRELRAFDGIPNL